MPLKRQRLTNCSLCGRICLENWHGLCKSCFEKQADITHKVEEYTKNNPSATLEEISEAESIELGILRKMAKVGKFDLASGRLEYPCKRCGKPITAGQLCHSCMNFFGEEIGKAKRSFERRHPIEARYRREKVAKQARMLEKIRKGNVEHHEPSVAETTPITHNNSNNNNNNNIDRSSRRMFYIESMEKRS